MDTQSFCHNSTRQEPVDNPPRWAVAQRSSGTCSDVPESYSFLQRATASETRIIQTDVPAKYVARRPMDQEAKVLSFLSNVQPRRILNALQNGAPSPRNSSLSITNSSERVFRHKTKFYDLPVFETITSKDYDEADDYINSMSQFNATTIKSHSEPNYAPLLKPIRNPEPMKFIDEPQTMPTIIDDPINDSNYIFSSQSESELATKDSTPFILRLNTFEDETDEFTSPCGLTTLNTSLNGSNNFIIGLDGSNINDATSAAQNLTPMCKSSELLDKLSVSEPIKNPSNGSEIPILHHISSSTSCRVPPDVTCDCVM